MPKRTDGDPDYSKVYCYQPTLAPEWLADGFTWCQTIPLLISAPRATARLGAAGWPTGAVIRDCREYGPEWGATDPSFDFVAVAWFDPVVRSARFSERAQRPDDAFIRILESWLPLLLRRSDLLPTIPALYDLGGTSAVYHLLNLEARRGEQLNG